MERVSRWFEFAAQQNVQQVVLGAPLGPEVREALQLWATELLPALR